MAGIVNHNIYMVVIKSKMGKKQAGVWTFKVGVQDVYAELQNIDGIENAIAFTSKKMAMDVAKEINDEFITNSNYLFGRGA